MYLLPFQYFPCPPPLATLPHPRVALPFELTWPRNIYAQSSTQTGHNLRVRKVPLTLHPLRFLPRPPPLAPLVPPPVALLLQFHRLLRVVKLVHPRRFHGADGQVLGADPAAHLPAAAEVANVGNPAGAGVGELFRLLGGGLVLSEPLAVLLGEGVQEDAAGRPLGERGEQEIEKVRVRRDASQSGDGQGWKSAGAGVGELFPFFRKGFIILRPLFASFLGKGVEKCAIASGEREKRTLEKC